MKRVRLIKMTGGLGNQMFIYAFYLQMKKRFPNTRIDLSDMMQYKVHHGYEMNQVFNLPHDEFCINQSLKKVLEFLLFKTILERKQKGSMEAYKKDYKWPLLYFKGFFQSEKHFSEISEDVHNAFMFDPKKASRQSVDMMRRIDADSCSVSLHVRRGDYLDPKHYQSIGCVCQLPYYKNAIAFIESKLTPSFYVFSDDIAWVKENLLLANAVYIDFNKGKDSWQDMMLMSHCRHNIICNSSFSWWGAWLNQNPTKKVVIPDKWFSGINYEQIYPTSWIKIPTE